MKVKFTYRRSSGDPVDLVAEFDAQATVGQLAHHLAAADPTRVQAADDPTLVINAERGELLDPAAELANCGLSSGAVVSLGAAPQLYHGSTGQQDAAAKLKALTGPDRGREFLLPAGVAVVGREHGCEIQLTDPLVSRRHARFNIGETIEVIDQGSANGLLVGLAITERATLRTGDIVTVGDTELEVTQLQRGRRTAGSVSFIRPARIAPSFEGREFDAPTPPERKPAPRFPTIALITPLIMGGVLFLTTHRLASIIFIALSPLMLIGNAIEGRIVGKREFRRAVEEFRSDLAGMVTDVKEAQAEEVRSRLEEHPSTPDCVAAVQRRSDLLWSRRPDLPAFGELRLGIGRRDSRSTIKLPNSSRVPRELTMEVESTAKSLRQIEGVPIVGSLAAGALGVAGPRVASLGEARALILQALALHAPSEMALAALLGPESGADWDFLKWTPHATPPQSPLTARPLVSTPDGASSLLADLENLIDSRGNSDDDSLPRVLLLIESDAPAVHSRLVNVAERGPASGVSVLWIAPDRSLLPAACKTFVDAEPLANDSHVGYVIEGESVAPVLLESLDAATASSLARALSPVEDAGARSMDDSDLPRTISQFAAMKDTTLGSRADSILERWQETGSILTGAYAPLERPKKAGSLRAVVGMSADGIHTLDLRTEGPHALVGGSTNSGKSEFLQTWILGMAATYSPERVNFLLVDYKGTSAFGDCAELPHAIGLITDLSPHMVRRALTSLSAELTAREHTLHDHDVKDLIEMEKHGIAGAPPALIIVIDEFAALVNDVPEFIEGVVNVAARGRSLGLHLILATQQPSGVIKGSLRANTNLRIALRVVDAGDSNDVIGTPDAASFDPQIPGRAMSRSGPKRLVAFQAAYAGGWTSDEPEPSPIKVEELTTRTASVWELPDTEGLAPKDREQTDIKRLVRTIGHANALAGLPEPPKAWQPVLPDAVDISTLPATRRDDTLVFALGDEPSTQSRPYIAFRPDREGNLAVYGASGSGKSTLLRAIAIASGFAQRGGPCHVYGLDFGSRALQMLEVLPHVGSIVPGAEHERVVRLISWLRQLVEDRKIRYSAVNAGTVTEFRSRAGQPDEPRILLMLDNVGAFRQAYETTDRQRYVDMLTAIASEGRGVGVHLCVASSERAGIHTTLSSAIQRRIVLRMPTEDDYSLLGVPVDVLDTHSVPGRGVDHEIEIQVGVLGEQQDDAYQAERIRDMAAALSAAGVSQAPPIRSLAQAVTLRDIGRAAQEVTIGLASSSLAPIGVDARGGFLITGPPGSGRTSTLLSLIDSVRRSIPGARLHYFGSRRSMIGSLPVWESTAFTVDDIVERAKVLESQIVGAVPGERFVVMAEGAGDLVMSAAEPQLQALVKACASYDQWFIAEGEVSTLKSAQGFLGLVKSSRRGLALQPDQETGSFFNTQFPRINRSDFPEGRGFLVGSGRAEVVQVGLSERGG